MASQIFGLPVAAVSLTDQDRQWFKSRVGVDHCSIPRAGAPCAEVAESTQALVIEDFLEDPSYAESPLGRAGTRFYAGVPLVTNDGYGLGALCVLGTEPRKASSAELAALTDLAAMVMAQIELQHAFGRIDPVSGMPTRNQFREDLMDLARDHAGKQYLAVVVDLAREDQISRITRAMGAARVDQMVHEAAQALRAALGPDRYAYQVGTAQFAFISPSDVEQSGYIELLRTSFASMRVSSSVRFVTNVTIGVRSFVAGAVSVDDVIRGATSAAQDARDTDGSIALYSQHATPRIAASMACCKTLAQRSRQAINFGSFINLGSIYPRERASVQKRYCDGIIQFWATSRLRNLSQLSNRRRLPDLLRNGFLIWQWTSWRHGSVVVWRSCYLSISQPPISAKQT